MIYSLSVKLGWRELSILHSRMLLLIYTFKVLKIGTAAKCQDSWHAAAQHSAPRLLGAETRKELGAEPKSLAPRQDVTRRDIPRRAEKTQTK
jgi:hypothetical protein